MLLAALTAGSLWIGYTVTESVAVDSVVVSVAVTGQPTQRRAYPRCAKDSVVFARPLPGATVTATVTAVAYRRGLLRSSPPASRSYTEPLASAGGATVGGVPFGPTQLFAQAGAVGVFSMTMDGVTASGLLAELQEARTKHVRLVTNMTGGAHDLYLTNGVFDRAKWQATMAGYDTPALKAAVAQAVADGTLLGNSVMDEPANVTWGPAGTLTKARIDSMCGAVKQIFPTLPVGVVHTPLIFEPSKSYRVCDFTVAQYRYTTTNGDVRAFRDTALALARRDHMGVAFSLNILHGGVPSTTCVKYAGDNAAGTLCPMTPQQITQWSEYFGAAGCWVQLWEYDATFNALPANQTAFRAVADSMKNLPPKSCRRTA